MGELLAWVSLLSHIVLVQSVFMSESNVFGLYKNVDYISFSTISHSCTLNEKMYVAQISLIVLDIFNDQC